MQSIVIRHVRVRRGALDLEVAAAVDTLHVTGEQADRVLGLLPNLAHHVCVNGFGDGSFGEELVGTELPHLLEHIIIELQGQASNTARHFTGHTSWLEELDTTASRGYALMRTTVTFVNDFVALQSASDACAIIAWIVNPQAFERPCIQDLVSKLVKLR